MQSPEKPLFGKFAFRKAVTFVLSVSGAGESALIGATLRALPLKITSLLCGERNCPSHSLRVLFHAKGLYPFTLRAGDVPSASLPVAALHAAALSLEGQICQLVCSC